MIDQSVTVAHPWWQRAVAWIVVPVLGAGLGWLLVQAADWIAGLRWAPMRGPAELLASLPEPQATIGAVALGTLAGAILARLMDQESLSVTIARERVTLSRPGVTRTIDRAAVATAFPDSDRLVLLDRVGAELAREPSHLSAARLSAAFGAYGIAWAAEDPYAGTYRRWVPDSPELPAGAHALLAARQEALKSGDTHDIAEFRSELARLGVVVRDEKKRQYWRQVNPG